MDNNKVNGKMKWYVLHIYTGQEFKVKRQLEARLKSYPQCQQKVGEILIPTEEKVFVEKGKKVKRERRLLPGYMFIQMDMDEELYRIIKQTPGVFDIVSDKRKPIPIAQEVVSSFLKEVPQRTSKKIPFEINETVRIIDGPFKDFIGTVVETDEKKQKVKIMMNILGRQTPVEIDAVFVGKL